MNCTRVSSIARKITSVFQLGSCSDSESVGIRTARRESRLESSFDLRGRKSRDLLLLFRRYVVWRRSCTFSEEILLHLLHDHFLIFSPSGVQPVFIEQHLAEFGPLLPRFLRNILIDLHAKRRIKRRLVQSWKFLTQLDAEYVVLCHDSPSDNYLT